MAIKRPLLACVVPALILLAGCGGGNDSSSTATSGSTTASTGTTAAGTSATTGGSDQKGTIRLLFNNSAQAAFQKTIQRFEAAYPNIKVNAQFVEGGALYQALLPQIQAGNPPDLFQTQVGTSPVSPLVLGKEGKVAPLTGSWTNNIWDQAKSLLTDGGKTYGYLTSVGPHGVAYNPAIFQKLGLTIPTTLSELVAMCPKIQAAGYTPIANGFGGQLTTGTVLAQMFSAEYVYGPDKDWDAQRLAKKTTFASSPEWKSMFDAISQINKAGCWGKGAGGTTLPAATNDFVHGKAAMSMLAFPQIAGLLAIDPKFQYKFFNLPAVKASDTVVSAAVSQALSLSATSKNVAAAQTFTNFLARPVEATAFATAGGGITNADAVAGKLPAFASDMAATFKANKVVVSTHPLYPNANLIVGTTGLAGAVTGVVTGQVSADKALKNLDYLWDHPQATDAP